MFSMLGSIMSANAQRKAAQRQVPRMVNLIERGETPQSPNVDAMMALARPEPTQTIVTNRDTGIGWGTVIVAFLLGGALS